MSCSHGCSFIIYPSNRKKALATTRKQTEISIYATNVYFTPFLTLESNLAFKKTYRLVLE